MKIKYFSYIAEQSFKTSPSGERLFYYSGGFWSKPYIIPNQETEKRLFQKQLWFMRIFLGTLIISQVVLVYIVPEIARVISLPIGFVLYFAVMTFLGWFVNWLIFRKDLQTLQQLTAHIPFSTFYRETAKRHSILGLIFGLLLCIGFLWVGYSMITSPSSAFIGWVCMIFSGFCGILWGYTLFLKLTMWKDKDVVKNKSEA